MANGKYSRLGTVTNMLHKVKAKNKKAESIGYMKGCTDGRLTSVNFYQSMSFIDRLRFLFNPKF